MMKGLLTVAMMMATVSMVGAQETVRLTLNFPLGGSASRVVSGHVKATYNGPTPLSPDKPETLVFDLKFRQTFFVSVEKVTDEGNGLISVQPMGTNVEGIFANNPLNVTISADGHLTASWGALSFDSAKLKPEEQAALKKMLTSRSYVTITRTGKVVQVSLPDIPPGSPDFSRELSQGLSWMLQMLTPVNFPEKPVRLGEEWKINLPIPIFEGEKVPQLTVLCRLHEIKGGEAIITATAESAGPADLTLKKLSPTDPQVTIKSGEMKGTARISFDLFVSVPRRSVWHLTAKAEGIIVADVKGEKKSAPFSLEMSGEVTDELLF
ncbi:MAG: hypothetical protein NZ959_04510 [Armatimonadetes bacterium]|nr:hypothetical protein [Armatimonadota bacterium]MDW8121826.1 hypothetical protein [Armatimonadota bacterium]